MFMPPRPASWLAIAALLQSLAASAADPEIVVAVEKHGSAFVVDATIDFPVPLRTAWEVLTDFDNMTAILSNLTASRIASRSGNTLQVQQEGVAHYGIFSYDFASEREIRLEPMKRILATQISGNAKSFASELQLSPNGVGTEARYHVEVVPDSGIARTFGGPFIKHEIEEQFSAMAAEMARRKAP
jgi:carbon monoxide dehydrogenase subunit G